MSIDTGFEFFILFLMFVTCMYYFGGLEEGRVRESWNAYLTMNHTLTKEEVVENNEKQLKTIKQQKAIALFVFFVCAVLLFGNMALFGIFA